MRFLENYYELYKEDRDLDLNFDEYISEIYSEISSEIEEKFRDFIKNTFGYIVFFVENDVEFPEEDDIIDSFDLAYEFSTEVRDYVGDLTEEEIEDEIKIFLSDYRVFEEE